MNLFLHVFKNQVQEVKLSSWFLVCWSQSVSHLYFWLSLQISVCWLIGLQGFTRLFYHCDFWQIVELLSHMLLFYLFLTVQHPWNWLDIFLRASVQELTFCIFLCTFFRLSILFLAHHLLLSSQVRLSFLFHHLFWTRGISFHARLFIQRLLVFFQLLWSSTFCDVLTFQELEISCDILLISKPIKVSTFGIALSTLWTPTSSASQSTFLRDAFEIYYHNTPSILSFATFFASLSSQLPSLSCNPISTSLLTCPSHTVFSLLFFLTGRCSQILQLI